MRLETTTEKDLPTIDAWCAYEPYLSRRIFDKAFLTGSPNSLLVFKLDDKDGPVLFCRIEADKTDASLARFHILFAPTDVVSKARVAKAMLRTMETVFEHFRNAGFRGIVFDSVSDGLIHFLSRFGFQPTVGSEEFYLMFEPVVLAS